MYGTVYVKKYFYALANVRSSIKFSHCANVYYWSKMMVLSSCLGYEFVGFTSALK